ncbi:hypothetical protein BpHYR1_002889 [Brachionus plicatilis]|uniref:Glucosylceramidase 4 n=1 Tax=Brachionus plicatilis TaxID=10195 RepID=A0A3M7P968_BRAPC|nr:hypothetical protein BpHYR1_002889 [Brachionus plicatilis]
MTKINSFKEEALRIRVYAFFNENRSLGKITEMIYFTQRGVIPFIKKHHSDGNYKFWPDLASSHYANTVVNYLIDQNIKFVQICQKYDQLKIFGPF